MPDEAMQVIKRDGRKESIHLEKIHFMTYEACEGLSGVSASQVEMNSGIQFYDGIKTSDIQQILVRSAADLIDLENLNYQYVAARLLLFGLRKEVFEQFDYIPLDELINKNIEKGLYDPAIVNEWYSKKEIERLNSYIKHKRDFEFTYAGLRQVVDKYLVQDRSSGQIYETPQYMYMMIAATLFAKLLKRN